VLAEGGGHIGKRTASEDSPSHLCSILPNVKDDTKNICMVFKEGKAGASDCRSYLW
jgi:hypothetical protein